MPLFHTFLSYLNFGLAVLLAMLFVFHAQLVLPAWMWPLGRMHPMLLHLPIGAFVVVFLLWLERPHGLDGSRRSKADSKGAMPIHGLLHFVAATALTTALLGLFLAAEPAAYAGDTLATHRNGGTALAFSLYLLAAFYPHLPRLLVGGWMLLNMGLMGYAGHQGASITHGADFLFPEIKADTVAVVSPSSNAFAALVQPILERKCVSCHQPSKSKGGLLLSDTLGIQKGGKHGHFLVAGDPKASLVIQRIQLPLQAEEHMPPDGKPQLTTEEIALLEAWIAEGASFQQPISAYGVSSAFYQLASNYFTDVQQQASAYSFPAAKTDVLNSLQTPYRNVQALYQASPALEATYFLAAAYEGESLKELASVKDQLVALKLNNMPVTDEDVAIIAGFPLLEQLALNGTQITDKALKDLVALKKLRQLSLANTAISIALAAVLPQWPALEKIYLSDTRISAQEVAQWRADFPHIQFFYQDVDKEYLALTPPMLENLQTVIGEEELIYLHHPIGGTEIRYTTDGSLPDSATGIRYEAPIQIENALSLHTIAWKAGWKASEVKRYDIFFKGNPPEETSLHSSANERYPGQGAATFTNGQRAPITNLKDANWIGFLEDDFAATFSYSQPKAIRQIAFSYALHIPQYVFPPTAVRVYAGNKPQALRLQKEVQLPPFQADNFDQIKNEVVFLELSGEAFLHYKIEADNVRPLPPWHPGRGTPAWLFIDELFFYE